MVRSIPSLILLSFFEGIVTPMGCSPQTPLQLAGVPQSASILVSNLSTKGNKVQSTGVRKSEGPQRVSGM